MDLERIVSELKRERDRLDRAIAVLEDSVVIIANSRRKAVAARPTAPAGRPRTGLTPAGRKRLSEMMKKRWAERRKKLS